MFTALPSSTCHSGRSRNAHYDESADINAGLYGPLIVYNKGILDNTTGLPKDVDREFVLLYLVSCM
jgi:hypothetical protein